MRVLVFGASGYIGRHAAKAMIAGGHEVTAQVRSESSARIVEEIGAKSVIGDIQNDAENAALIDAHDAVVWIAQLMFEDELRTVTAMIDRMAGTGKTLIFTGGTSLLSQKTNGYWSENNYAEDEPFPPRKQIAPRLEIEGLVRAAAAKNVRSMVIRPALVWGNGGSQLIAEFYHSASKTGAVCHIGPGYNVYSNIHVDDLGEIYRLMLEKGVPGALYHASSGEVSYGVIADRIARHLGVPTRSVTIEEGAEIWDKFMAGIVLCSCSRVRSPRTRADLGWTPHLDRLNILDDCVHPAYGEMGDRQSPSWVKRAS